MTYDPNDESSELIISETDRALDALLRRGDRAPRAAGFGDLESRILSAAAFPLAARRRAARTTTAETLAAWVRIALPLAAAAALFVAVSLARFEKSSVADAELRDSDPGALLFALESSDARGLASHVISSDADTGVGLVAESR